MIGAFDMIFLKSWVIIGFYSIACAGLGELAYRVIDAILQSRSRSIQQGSLVQNFIIGYSGNLIVGVALLGMLWTFVALPGQLSPQVIFGVLLPFFVFSCWQILHNRKRLWDDIKRIASAIWQVGWLYKLICFASLYSIIVIVFNQYNVYPGDASAYYFALAKVIASSHTLKVLPGYYFGTFPSEAMMGLGLHGELHMAAIFSLGADHFARYFDIVLLIVSVAVLLKFLSMAGVKTRGLLITMLVILLSTSVITITAIGKVDLYGIAFTLGAIYFAGLYFFNPKDPSALALSGILIGTAVTTKLSYLVNMLPAIVILLFWNSVIIPFKEDRHKFLTGMRQNFRAIMSIALILGGAILLSMLSYFVKNQVVLGFFLAPFFMPKDVLNAITVLFPSSTMIKFVLTYPFTLSFFDIPMNPGNFPPLVLAFLPNLYFARKHLKFNSLSTASFIAGLLGIFLWIIFFPGVPFVRYIFTALILLLPLVLYATEYVLDQAMISSLRIAIYGSLLIATVFGLLNPSFVNDQIKLITTRLNPNISLCGFPQCEQDQAINKYAAAGDRLLNLSDFRYWLRPDLIECSASTQETNEILSAPKDKFWETSYMLGIKYVSLSLPTKGLEDPATLPKPEWLKINEIYRNDGSGLIVYRIDSSSAPYPPRRQCLQKHSPAWDVVNQP
jgi:hypothetical protein